MNKPTLDALRDIANSYCKGEEIQRVLLEEVLERFICLADEKLTSSEYVPDLVSDNYNDLAVLYVAGPNATWRAWAEARMVVILKKADAWHPELNPNGVNERPISGPIDTQEKP